MLEVGPVAGLVDYVHGYVGRGEPRHYGGGDDLCRHQYVLATPKYQQGTGELAGPFTGGMAVVPHVRHCPYNLGA